MNAKAEKIEHLIQIINRNLLLIYNGQVDGTEFGILYYSN
jgi:hypothetical protein